MGRRGALDPSLRVPLGPRIVVGGLTGSGKTTLSRELARRIGGVHIELDALHHKPGWQESTTEELREKLVAAIAAAGDRWVLDGNYSKTRDLTWPHATTFVWLDYPFGLATVRVVRRTARRLRDQQPLWHDNREHWRNLLKRSHPIWWSLHQFRHRRQNNTAAVADPRWAHLDVVRIRRPSQLRQWLDFVGQP